MWLQVVFQCWKDGREPLQHRELGKVNMGPRKDQSLLLSRISSKRFTIRQQCKSVVRESGGGGAG